MGFSTVFGHLMEGEERFSVEFREQDSTVWLDLYSVSRGHGILGKVWYNVYILENETLQL